MNNKTMQAVTNQNTNKNEGGFTMMYTNLYNQAIIENNEQASKAKSYLHTDVYQGAESVLQRWSTPTRWNQYQTGKITREQAVAYAETRIDKYYAKYLAKDAGKLETAKTAEPVTSITIYVHWTKSAVWGYNPTATVKAYNNGRIIATTTGKASGCGYDKRSAAIASALNEVPGIMQALYNVKENAIAVGYKPTRENNYSNADCIAYGAGYGAIPYFEGGVGIASTLETLKKSGFNLVESDTSGKHDDWYFLELQEV